MTTRTRPSCRATPPDPLGPVRCASPRGRALFPGPASQPGRRPLIHATTSITPLLLGRGRARHAAAPIGEGHNMRNIIRIGAGTDGRNRFVAIALGVALAAGPAAMMPAAALAAPATDAAAASTTAGATITLQGADGASLAGHTFDMYRIGTYTDQILNGTQISSLGVRGDTASNAWGPTRSASPTLTIRTRPTTSPRCTATMTRATSPTSRWTPRPGSCATSARPWASPLRSRPPSRAART